MTCWFQCWENSAGFTWSLITMVLLIWRGMGLFLRKNHLLRCWGWPSVLNWIGVLRGFSWGWQMTIFAGHWTTNDLKVTGHKSITIYSFLSEIIFRKKMVSLSNNDKFDNNKIFLHNIWHFSIIRINYVIFLHLS